MYKAFNNNKCLSWQTWVTKQRPECVEKLSPPVMFLAVAPRWPSQLQNTEICFTFAPVSNMKDLNKCGQMSVRYWDHFAARDIQILHESKLCLHIVFFHLCVSVFYFFSMSSFCFLLYSLLTQSSYCLTQHNSSFLKMIYDKLLVQLKNEWKKRKEQIDMQHRSQGHIYLQLSFFWV